MRDVATEQVEVIFGSGIASAFTDQLHNFDQFRRLNISNVWRLAQRCTFGKVLNALRTSKVCKILPAITETAGAVPKVR